MVSTMTTNSSVGPSSGRVMRPEPPHAAGAVDRRRLVEIAGDRLQTGGDEDEREPEAGPDARRGDRRQGGALVVEQAGLLDDREQVAAASRRWTARRRSAGAGSTTSGWRRPPTWRPSTRRSRGRRRRRARTCRRGPPSRRPSASPIGTVIRANLNVTTTASRNSLLRIDVEVLVPPAGPAVVALRVAALLAEPHRPAERVEDEHRQHDERGRQQQDAAGRSRHRSALRRRGVGHVIPCERVSASERAAISCVGSMWCGRGTPSTESTAAPGRRTSDRG